VKVYRVGQSVRLSAVFRDPYSSDALIDPTNVYFVLKAPSGRTIFYTYAVDVELVRETTGTYHVDVSATEPGRWQYRFYSTGTGQAAEEEEFLVQPHNVK